MDLAELVYGDAPPVVLVTVTAERFDFGADLSSPVASALPSVVDAVVAVVDTLLSETAGRDQGPIGVGRSTIRTPSCVAHDRGSGYRED